MSKDETINTSLINLDATLGGDTPDNDKPKLDPSFHTVGMSFDAVAGILKKEGFEQTRQKGSHVRFEGPNGEKTTVPNHGGKDLRLGTLNSIWDDAGLSEFRNAKSPKEIKNIKKTMKPKEPGA